MKKMVFFVLLVGLIASCSLISTDTDVIGTYLYTGTFISQKLFKDTTDTSAGDTTITLGGILLTWQTIEAIKGDYIKIEKSVGNNTSYEMIDSVPVTQNGSFIDSILSGNDYYYKLTLIDGSDESFMTEYKVIIPTLTISTPTITQTDLPPTGFDITYDNVNADGTYAVKIKKLEGDSLVEIWSKEDISGNTLSYDGDSLATGIYTLEVTTIIQDLQESGSLVSTTGITQFIIQ